MYFEGAHPAGVAGLSYSPGQIVELCTLDRGEIEKRHEALRGDTSRTKDAYELGIFLLLLGNAPVAEKAAMLSGVWLGRPGPQHLDFSDVNRIVADPPKRGLNEWADTIVAIYAEFVEATQSCMLPD